MTRPNVLLITCHDLGRHLHCYGHRTVYSPHLDRLAAQGVRFENSFCTAPQCSPSRSSIATGRFPHANGMLGLAHAPFRWTLHPEERTLPMLLEGAGYRTALAGLQHIGPRAEDLGFQESPGRGTCREVAELATGYLEKASRAEGPFYLEVGFVEPHRPFEYGGVAPDDSLGVEIPPYLPDVPEARSEMAAIQGAIRAMDGAVGRILDSLDSLDLAGNTVVVFIADHGIAFPRAKCTLYDPGIEAALLLRWPSGKAAGGRVCREMISHVDLLPTLLEVCGLPLPGNLHGRSFLPWIQDRGYEPRTEVFAEKTFHSYYDPMRCIRTARWKYILNLECNFRVEVPMDILLGRTFPRMIEECCGGKHPPAELYDLEADPGERENRSGRGECEAVEADLRMQLVQWMQNTHDPLVSAPPGSPFYREQVRKF